jgi:hypothetical protein
MKPQRAPEGQLRRIVGFRLDENLDWVAKLECGHPRLARQTPQFMVEMLPSALSGRNSLGEMVSPSCGNSISPVTSSLCISK